MARIDVVMPKMGESIMEGTILKWRKKVGDPVQKDESILDIATDKVDAEVPATETGTLAEILFEEGAVVPVGQAIARIESDASVSVAVDAAPQPVAPQTETEPVAQPVGSAQSQPEPVASNGNGNLNGNGNGKSVSTETGVVETAAEGRFYSPVVMNVASAEGVTMAELNVLSGSGIGGRVTKSDLLNYVEKRKSGAVTGTTGSAVSDGAVAASAKSETQVALTGKTETPVSKKAGEKADETVALMPKPVAAASHPAPPVVYDATRSEVIPMDNMRKLIAEHMVRSKHTSAHVTSVSEADVTNLVKLVKQQKVSFEQANGVKLTYTPFFIDAVVKTLKQYPMVNASVDGDKIILKKYINLGMAVALGENGAGGLIVPVIKNADEKNLVGIARSVQDLASRARAKKLLPDDIQGGTFTLTNYGTTGNLFGSPIINQPQVAILGTGAIVKRPVVITDAEGNDSISIRSMMYLSLSYDHRIIDGALGGYFLMALVKNLENYEL